MESYPAEPAVQWLLESASPSARCRTLVELLNRPPDDPEVQAARAAIPTSKTVERIFARMHPDGYWLHRGIGAGLNYAMSSSTHFALAFLAELGLDRADPRVACAAERYLALFEQEEGRFFLRRFDLERQSCLYAYNLRTFTRLGYRDHERVQAWVQNLIEDTRFDGGYLCVRPSFKAGTRSCIRGSVKALTAYAELPETWDQPRCRQLVDYFLRRRVLFRERSPEQVIRGEMTAAAFPFLISGSLLEPLHALSRMGYGRHPALSPAWELLESKKDDRGRIALDWCPSDLIFNPGPKGEANEWTTLYALLAWKDREIKAPRF